MTAATERLEALVAQHGRVAAELDAIKRRPGKAQDGDVVERLLAGQDIDSAMPAPGPDPDVERLYKKLEALQMSINKQSQVVQIEKMQMDRDERARQRPKYIAAVKKYVASIRALGAAQTALREFDEWKMAPFSYPGLPRLGDERMEQVFRQVLQHKGINPGDVGVEVPEPYVPPKVVLSPERQKNLRERFPESVLVSDMPKPGHFV